MSKFATLTQSMIGRATIGFAGTVIVLLGTPLLAPDASAATPVAIDRLGYVVNN